MTGAFRNHLVRFLLLAGVMGGLLALLAWQRRHLTEQAAAPPLPGGPRPTVVSNDPFGPPDEPAAIAIRFDPLLPDLEPPLRKAAQAAAPEIAALRRARAEATRWPELLVPEPTDAWLWRTTKADYLEYRLRDLDAYRRLTRDPEDARGPAAEFLEAAIRETATLEPTDADLPKLNEMAQAALAAGSRDPLVRAYAAYTGWFVRADQKETEQGALEILRDLSDREYPRALAVSVRKLIWEISPARTQVDARWRALVVAVVRWLEEEVSEPRWRRCVWERLMVIRDAASAEQRSLLFRAVLQGTVDPYIVHTLAGYEHLAAAWRQRGSSWAYEVPPEKWDGFHEQLRIASDHLQYAWLLDPRLPYAPTSLITVAKASPDSVERPYFWFLRSVEAQFDTYHAYNALLSALQPRWGGSRPAMLAFARNCLDTRRFDTHVPYFAIDVLERLESQELEAQEPLAKVPGVTALLAEFLVQRNRVRERRPPEGLYEDQGRYRAPLVRLLETCDLWTEAAAEYRAAGDQISWTVLRKQLRPARFLAARLLAAPAELRPQLIAFDERLRQPCRHACTSESLRQLADEWDAWKARLEEPDGEYRQHVDAMLRQLQTFAAGEWTPLPFDKQLHGWEPYCDGWDRSDDGRVTLFGRIGKAPQVCLRPLVCYDLPLEVDGELELLDPPPYLESGIGWTREGLHDFRDVEAALPHFGHFAFQSDYEVSRRYEVAWVRVRQNKVNGHYRVRSAGPHRIHLRLWPQAAEYAIDHTWIAVRLPADCDPQGSLCFGENVPTHFRRLDQHGAARWGGLRVRRLDIPPPPDEFAPLPIRAAYWETRFAQEPDSALARVRLAVVRYEQDRFDAVLQMTEPLLQRTPEPNDLRKWRGLVHRRQRDYVAALEDFTLALDDAGDDPDVYAHLAELLAAAPDDRLRNPQRALQLANLSQQVSGGRHARTLAALAAIHSAQGDFQQAVELQSRALLCATEPEEAEWEPRLAAYHAGRPWRLPAAADSAPAEPSAPAPAAP